MAQDIKPLLSIPLFGLQNIRSRKKKGGQLPLLPPTAYAPGILEEQSGRFHTSFPNFRPVLLQGSNKVFQEWIKTHLQSWIT